MKNSLGRILDVRQWRISRRLVLVMLLVSLIPLLGATLIGISTSSRALTRQTRINLSRLSYSTAQRIEQFLVDNHNFVRMTAGDPDVVEFIAATPEQREALRPQMTAVISNVLDSNEAADLVAFYDGDGIVIEHSIKTFVGQNYRFRDYVQSALRGEQFTSSIQIGLTTNQPGINAAAPVYKDDQIVGAMAIRIKGEYITAILESTLDIETDDITPSEKQAIDIFLTNQYGIVMDQSSKEGGWLYHSLGTIQSTEVISEITSVKSLGGVCPDGTTQCDAGIKIARMPEPIPAAQDLGDRLLAAFKAGESSSYRYCKPNAVTDPASAPESCAGTWHVVGYAPVRDPFRRDPATSTPYNLFMIVVDVPEQIFLQSIDQQRNQGIIIAVTMALLAVLASVVVARTLATPIDKLARAARAIEHDQPFEPADIVAVTSRGDEIGGLARVFSNMVVSLRARMAELRTIYEVGSKITASVDLQETLDYILNAISGIIPSDAAEISLYDAQQQQLVPHAYASIEFPSGAAAVRAGHSTAQPYLARLLESRTGLLIPDLQADPDAAGMAARQWQSLAPRSYLGVPLKTNEGVIGAIELVSRRPHGFTADQLRLLESVAVQASVAVQNARQVQQRENLLKQQIQELKIEIDEAKRAKQVEEITGTDFFEGLRAKAQRLRARKDEENG